MPYRKAPDAGGLSVNISFMVTEDCNLRCKYCYEENKCHKTMTPETADKIIDFIFDKYVPIVDSDKMTYIFDFIGGEPFMAIDIVDRLTEGIKRRICPMRFMLSFSTNGTYFKDPRVIAYLDRNKHLGMSVGLSLDGCKEIHDMNRSGSFDSVMDSFLFWRERFPDCAIKATVNPEALPYIPKSHKFFYDIGLKDVFMNTIFEDVWQPGDDEIYYNALIETADFLLEDRRYERFSTSLFSQFIGRPTFHQELNESTWCGSGQYMIHFDTEGFIYPCLRFATTSNQPPFRIGHIDTGINANKLLPFCFYNNSRNTISECMNCQATMGCAHCVAYDYDMSGSIFTRAMYSCAMHKARTKANQYFFDQIEKIEKRGD